MTKIHPLYRITIPKAHVPAFAKMIGCIDQNAKGIYDVLSINGVKFETHYKQTLDAFRQDVVFEARVSKDDRYHSIFDDDSDTMKAIIHYGEGVLLLEDGDYNLHNEAIIFYGADRPEIFPNRVALDFNEDINVRALETIRTDRLNGRIWQYGIARADSVPNHLNSEDLHRSDISLPQLMGWMADAKVEGSEHMWRAVRRPVSITWESFEV